LKVGSGKRTEAVAADGAKENEMEVSVFEKVVRVVLNLLIILSGCVFVAFIAAVYSGVLV